MIDTTDGNDTSSLMTSKKIKKYLQNNPNFFHDNPSVLELLNLPHASGEAISLIERQIALLRTKNLELSKHIKDLLVTAENNVKLFVVKQICFLDKFVEVCGGLWSAVSSPSLPPLQHDTRRGGGKRCGTTRRSCQIREVDG